MLTFNKTAKIAKIQVFDGKSEAQNYFKILSALNIDVESFFVGVNDNFECVYYIDENLDFDELPRLLEGYQIKIVYER